MLSSMTGYGKSEIRKDGILVSVEVKSINSRFLEISLKLPKILQSKEFEIRELILFARKFRVVRLLLQLNLKLTRQFNRR